MDGSANVRKSVLTTVTDRLSSALGRFAMNSVDRCRQALQSIDAWEAELRNESDEKLRRRTAALRYRARVREPAETLLPESFAIVREASQRTIGMRHFDVQMLGGLVMCKRSVAEMQTGEGKTLTATLPLYFYALRGRGSHLATVNDYLARRDADIVRPVFELLGLSVGVIESLMSPDERRQAYACDVTYGTAKEFGFDCLRDRLLDRRPQETVVDRLIASRCVSDPESRAQRNAPANGKDPVGREPYFVLVDEADSILIDEAGTPLIIGSAPEETQRVEVRFRHCALAIDDLSEDRHFTLDAVDRSAQLTSTGRQRVRSWQLCDELSDVSLPTIYEDVERALVAQHFYQRDRHYVVLDEEIQIVDEFTGRLAEGRRWQRGLHQAIEAKEGLKVLPLSGPAARITVQDFFLRYRHLAGMSGTVTTSRRELRRIYRLGVEAILTHRPPFRQRLVDQVFATTEEKWTAIAAAVVDISQSGRPVLIGTRSIDKSERLSQLLTVQRVDHQVLNARHIAAEAEIVARAGRQGCVTVATNMAGRGTDIHLGPGVKELGGVHVICSELHDSPRIDRQLIGRCGRQGDPGSFRRYMALDDDILQRGLGADAAARLRNSAANVGILSGYVRYFVRAQRNIERRNLRCRQAMLRHEKQWHKLQKQLGLDPHLDVFE
jgi:preprotein translocase subunit SecA